MDFSIDKTTVIMLTNKYNRERRPRISLQDRPMRVLDSVKYLGLIWGEEMSCEEHVMVQSQKLITTIFGLVALTRTRGGMECLALRRFYEGARSHS